MQQSDRRYHKGLHLIGTDEILQATVKRETGKNLRLALKHCCKVC